MTARRIIVGYDRSPDAKAAAAWALDEAAGTGAPVEFSVRLRVARVAAGDIT